MVGFPSCQLIVIVEGGGSVFDKPPHPVKIIRLQSNHFFIYFPVAVTLVGGLRDVRFTASVVVAGVEKI